MKRLYQKIGHTLKYSPKKDSLTFTGYVKAVKYASTLASATPPNKEQASDRTG
jgi:hypothetical protein